MNYMYKLCSFTLALLLAALPIHAQRKGAAVASAEPLAAYMQIANPARSHDALLPATIDRPLEPAEALMYGAHALHAAPHGYNGLHSRVSTPDWYPFTKLLGTGETSAALFPFAALLLQTTGTDANLAKHCLLKPEVKKGPAIVVTVVAPASGETTVPALEKIPLIVKGTDCDKFVQLCECWDCGEKVCVQPHVFDCADQIKYTWKKESGGGTIDCTDRPGILFTPPDSIALDSTKVSKITAEISDVRGNDKVAKVKYTITIKRTKVCEYKVTIAHSTETDTDENVTLTGSCTCAPKPHSWEKTPTKLSGTPGSTSLKVCINERIVVKASATDTDKLILECDGDCGNAKQEPQLIDALQYTWSASLGSFPDYGGSAVTSGPNSSAIYKAPANAGSDTIRIIVDDGNKQGNDDPDTLKIPVKVFKVDLQFEGVAEAEEICPGAFLCLNNDDDNKNYKPDTTDKPTVTDENDLKKIILTKTPQEGNVTLKALKGGDKIKIWTQQTKGTEITLPKTYQASALPETLWVEGFKTSKPEGDIELALECADAKCGDKIKLTVVDFDLDVNANKNLTNTFDRAMNYLPGYGPKTGDSTKQEPKVSSGTRFHNRVYTGQEMKLVVLPIGTGSVIDEIEFKILNVTTYSGYCENATHANIIGADKNDDYSFKQPVDEVSTTGTMEAGKTTVPFWCKDYGGYCEVEAHLKKGGNTLLVCKRVIPLDHDNDKIADKWEKEKVTEWNTQFGVMETVGNAFFAAADDKELKDPDGANTDGGTNMTEHAAAGDKRTVIKEYRGYILDGGGHDWDGNNAHQGGHARLNPAYKEVLIETDAMTGVANMPNRAGIEGWMNTIATGYSQKTDGKGLRMFYIVEDVATPHNIFTATVMKTTRQLINEYGQDQVHDDLTSFYHLQLADHFDGMGTSGLSWSDVLTTYAVDSGKDFADGFGIAHNTSATAYISHELHHKTANYAVGSDGNGHFDDTNGDGTGGQADDKDRVLWNYNYAYPNKSLNGAINATTATITLNNTTDLTTTGWVQIGAEWIKYTGIAGNQLTGCTRGFKGTAAAAHANNSVVRPKYSSEEMKKIKYGLGTTKHINIQ